MSIDNSFLPLITVLSSGVFSLLVSLTSILITTRLTTSTEKRRIITKKKEDLINLFTDLYYQITSLVQEIDYLEEKRDKSRVSNIALLMAKLNIVTDFDELIKQIENTLSSYNDYLDIHYANKPKKINGSIIISSTDKIDLEREKTNWSVLIKSISETKRCMKDILKKRQII